LGGQRKRKRNRKNKKKAFGLGGNVSNAKG